MITMDGMPATQFPDFVKKTKMKNKNVVNLISDKQNMKELIQKTIDLLKRKVRENLEIINKNQTRLNEMLNQPFSSERTYMIEKNYSANKSLLAENNDLISLQLNLVSFLEKYKETMVKWEDVNEPLSELDIAAFLDDDELFELTIQGKLGFETGHPRFKDEAFFTKLLNYYASIEAYEKCNAIIAQRRKNQLS
jgi:hypothetical protein